MFKSLKKLVEQNSHSNNPEGVNKCGEMFKEMVSDLPIEWSSFESVDKGFGNLFVGATSKDKNQPNIILSGHLDTVFQSHASFDIHVDRGRLYGPGTYDMKSSLFAISEILRKLKSENKLNNITVMLFPDEEQMTLNRFPKAKEIAKQNDYALVFEGSTTGDAHKRNLVVSRKGFVGYEIELEADGGHSGVIEKEEERHSAIHEAINLSNKILETADFSKRTTTNVGIIKGGIAVNALAQNAKVHFDSRVVDTNEYERVLKIYSNLTKYIKDKEVRLSYKAKMEIPPFEYSSKSMEIFNKIKVYLDSNTKFEIVEEKRGGGSDANRYSYYNPEMVVYDGFGPFGAGDHTEKEYVALDDIPVSINFAYEFIKAIRAIELT